jgi:hypothetical protein
MFACLLIVFALPRVVIGDTVLIEPAAEWCYLDDGSDPGEAWKDAGFDDSEWPSGPAKLGRRVGNLATELEPRVDHLTTYFRHLFHVPDPRDFRSLRLRVNRDDGAVLYVNGREVYRTNMPPGEVGPDTPAASGVRGGGEWMEAIVSADTLQSGTNVVAAEVHQIRLDSTDLSFDLELIGSHEPYLRAVKGPYLLFSGEPGSMTVLWQLNGTATCRLQWGPVVDPSAARAVTTEYGTDHQHRVTMTGLETGALYTYRLRAGENEHVASFRAAAAPDRRRLKMLVYGDTQTGSNVPERIHDAMLGFIERDPEFQTLVLHTGDWVRSDDEDTWTRQFFNPSRVRTREMIARVPVVGCIGNHDLWGGTFRKYWPFPYVEDRYWSFDYGPAHVTIVDVYSDYSPNSKQLAWIEEDLRSSDSPWKFLILHEPGYSAGHHRNNSDVQVRLQPLCERHGVALVFAGHNHYYARCLVNGVHHITTGGGGAGPYGIDVGSPHLVTATSVHHFCAVDIDGDRLTLTAHGMDDAIIDEFVVSR